MFDWLHRWFTLPDFNGCAFANARNEVATLSPEASAIIDEHFAALRSYLRDITRPLPEATRIADELLVVLEGAIVLARSLTSSRPARTAKKVALQLVDEAERPTR